MIKIGVLLVLAVVIVSAVKGRLSGRTSRGRSRQPIWKQRPRLSPEEKFLLQTLIGIAFLGVVLLLTR